MQVTREKISRFVQRTTRGYKFLVTGETVHVAPVPSHDILGAQMRVDWDKIVGAGFIRYDGDIEDWRSGCYGVTTPMELRPAIEAAVKTWFKSEEGKAARLEDGVK